MRSTFNPPGRAQSLPVAPVSFWPSGKVWPNGNFTLGVTREVEKCEGMLWPESDYELPDWVLIRDAESDPSDVALSNGSISHKASPRARKGLKGISGYGQQVLRSAAYLVERDYGKDDLCFATLTLPKLPREARRQLQSNWAKLLNRFVQFVCRKLQSAGRPLKVFGCVEIMSQRLDTTSEGYLHLHAVWPSHSNQAGRCWAVEADELRAWWKSAVERFSGITLAYAPRVDTVPVKYSCEHYLGKYLSKGGGLIDDFIAAEGEESCPTAWWFASKPMKDQVKSETVSGTDVGVLLDALITGAFEASDLGGIEWFRAVDMMVGGRRKTVGWCGRLDRKTADDILRLMAFADG